MNSTDLRRILRRSPAVAISTTLASLSFLLGAAAVPAHASSGTSALGVDLPSGFYSTSAVNSFQSLVGAPVGVVQNFVSWQYTNSSTDNEFPYWRVRDIIANGQTPEITWDPTIAGNSSVNQPSMSLADIADGEYDSYIDQFAAAAASVHSPILLRFGHEMNGTWTSYSEANSGNGPGEFVQAWRHVWTLFQQQGATNVSWIWSPNIVASGDSSLQELYPGDAYVNWVGLDGYSYPLAGCKSAQQTFGPAVQEIARFTSRPMVLAEVGVSSACTNKPALITGLFSWLQTQPEIRSMTWWERSDSGGDWLIESSSASENAFDAGFQHWSSWLSQNPFRALSTSSGTSTSSTVTAAVTRASNRRVTESRRRRRHAHRRARRHRRSRSSHRR